MLQKGNHFKGINRKGLSQHPLFHTWRNMIRRCNGTCKYEKDKRRYAERGITVCEEWLNDYEIFYYWAIAAGWQKGLQIDRINNDGNYEPNNCRFVDCKTNNSNRPGYNNYIESDGKKLTISEWSRITGLERNTIYNRLKKGYAPEYALMPTKQFKQITKR